MITTKTVETTKQIFDSRTCNGCGMVHVDNERDGGASNHEFGDGIHVEDTGGYYSRIGDGAFFSFDLCDRCIIKLMDSFVVPATRVRRHPITGKPE